jgi:hypothetical protein
MTLTIRSSAFSEGSRIPPKYTCDGQDTSPPLTWTGIPAGANTLALTCDDPDAPSGLWVHWVVFDLPPSVMGLPEGVPPTPEISGGGRQGKNDFRKIGYGGPCPPSGTHRYVFTLYALDSPSGLPAGATRQDLLALIKNHVLGQATLTGTYSRR